MKWGPKFNTSIAKPYRYDSRFNKDFISAENRRKNPWAIIRGLNSAGQTKYRERMRAKKEASIESQEDVDSRVQERIENTIALLETCLLELSTEARKQGGNKSRFNQGMIVAAMLKLQLVLGRH
jgi:hypothetical protein